MAHTGIPRTKLDVPSIGSTTQRHAESLLPTTPCSSPSSPSSGRRIETTVGNRRFGISIGLGDLGVVRLPRQVERALFVQRQGDAIGDLGQFETEGEVCAEVAVDAHRGNSGRRRSRRADRPSAASGPRKLSISYASEASKLGSAWRSQWLSARLVSKRRLARARARVARRLPRRPAARRRRATPSTPDRSARLPAVDEVAGQQVVLGLGHAAQQRPDRGGVVAGCDAEADVAIGQPAVLVDDRDVGHQGHRQPGADGDAVDRTDDRRVAFDHRAHDVARFAHDLHRSFVVADLLGDPVEVAAGAERRALPVTTTARTSGLAWTSAKIVDSSACIAGVGGVELARDSTA